MNATGVEIFAYTSETWSGIRHFVIYVNISVISCKRNKRVKIFMLTINK